MDLKQKHLYISISIRHQACKKRYMSIRYVEQNKTKKAEIRMLIGNGLVAEVPAPQQPHLWRNPKP
jgi:hypothetical protein